MADDAGVLVVDLASQDAALGGRPIERAGQVLGLRRVVIAQKTRGIIHSHRDVAKSRQAAHVAVILVRRQLKAMRNDDDRIGPRGWPALGIRAVNGHRVAGRGDLGCVVELRIAIGAIEIRIGQNTSGIGRAHVCHRIRRGIRRDILNRGVGARCGIRCGSVFGCGIGHGGVGHGVGCHVRPGIGRGVGDDAICRGHVVGGKR